MPGLDTIPRLAAIPLRLAWRAGSVAVSAVETVVERLPGLDGHEHRYAPAQSRPAEQPAAPAPPAPPPAAAAPARPAAPPPPPPPAPDPEPPAHVDEEAVLVAESADVGAADGAGAEVRIDEPWPGYSKWPAAQIIDALTGASPEKLAAVRLYEAVHQGRPSVLRHADRQLELSRFPAKTSG
jgi:hypothetical protein